MLSVNLERQGHHKDFLLAPPDRKQGRSRTFASHIGWDKLSTSFYQTEPQWAWYRLETTPFPQVKGSGLSLGMVVCFFLLFFSKELVSE